MIASRLQRVLLALPLALTGGCSGWFFSGIDYPDDARPVVRIDTQGGVEFGAATEFGVLFLGRTATSGPCRVHYFLGEQLLVDDGIISRFGGPFVAANIDLTHQGARLWTDPLDPNVPLIAMTVENGTAERLPVRLAREADIDGDVLIAPERPLPIGTPLFVPDPDGDDDLWFVGLVSGEATLERPGQAASRYLVFAGLQAMREALEVPDHYLAPLRVKYRPDGLWIEVQDRRGTTGEPEQPTIN